MFFFLAIIAGSPYSSLDLIENFNASVPIGLSGLYSPGPGDFVFVLANASRPAPKEYVLPLQCTAKVEVVWFGLNRVGIL